MGEIGNFPKSARTFIRGNFKEFNYNKYCIFYATEKIMNMLRLIFVPVPALSQSH